MCYDDFKKVNRTAVIIYMFAKDHFPPHFHVKYGGYKAIIGITTGEVVKGDLPRRALRLIEDWIGLHQTELNNNWKESQKENPDFNKIEPLK